MRHEGRLRGLISGKTAAWHGALYARR